MKITFIQNIQLTAFVIATYFNPSIAFLSCIPFPFEALAEVES